MAAPDAEANLNRRREGIRAAVRVSRTTAERGTP